MHLFSCPRIHACIYCLCVLSVLCLVCPRVYSHVHVLTLILMSMSSRLPVCPCHRAYFHVHVIAHIVMSIPSRMFSCPCPRACFHVLVLAHALMSSSRSDSKIEMYRLSENGPKPRCQDRTVNLVFPEFCTVNTFSCIQPSCF